MNKIVKASSKDYKNNKGKILDNSIAVSYTHLTLPTN